MSKPHFTLKTDGSVRLAVRKSTAHASHETVGGLSPDFAERASASHGYAPAISSIFDGEKFPGGFGPTQVLTPDYWTLRARSAELFSTNLYARGLIRRLVTNEINTGLTPEAAPDEEVLGLKEGTLVEWSESTESRFGLWAQDPRVCDHKQKMTFGAIQRVARSEALVEGDVLVVMRQSQRTNLPTIELVRGSRVQTPFNVKVKDGHKITHGVETDAQGRIVAHWVTQEGADAKRVPARGEKSGRRISWLVYGTDKRLDDVRGEPLLALMLQSLKEIDRYRDSAQRKATVNSMLAMFIQKDADKMGTLPITGGAVKKGAADGTTTDGPARPHALGHIPGVVMEELQMGEKPVGFNSAGTDEKFSEFEAAVLHTVAWASEMPPEILTLAFSNNYSASQAAINEFKIYLNKIWANFGEEFCMPIYSEWLISEVYLGDCSAPGLLDAWNDTRQYATRGAWLRTDWYGQIKPSTDMGKQVKASGMLIDRALSTGAREARITTGTKFSQNIKRITRENEQLAAARRPLAEFENEFGTPVPNEAVSAQAVSADEVMSIMDDYLEERELC